MTRQQREVQETILSMAEEQVMFLRTSYKMGPEEIINLYTGERYSRATYGDAIRSIVAFTEVNAKKQGFLAS